MSLSPQQKQCLVERILDCPCIRESRDTVVKQLPTRIHNAIERSPYPKIDVFQILETCIRYPWGIEYLIQAIRFFDGGTTQIAHFYDELEIIQRRYQAISSNRLAALWEFLQTYPVPDDALRQFYHSSVSTGAELPPHCEGLDTLTGMLSTLANMSVEPGTIHPLLTFAAQFISHTSDPDIQRNITTWIETTAAHLGIKREDVTCLLDASKPAESPPTAFPLYLLIELVPREESPDCYIIQAWVWSNHRKKQLAITGNRHALDAIPQIINNLIEAIVDDQLAAQSPPTIELFLPRALLGGNVDQWVLDEDETLGFRYSVAVRFHERATNKKYWPTWIRRWNGIDGTPSDHHSLIEKVYSSEQCTSRSLRLKLEEVLCLALTCALHPESEVQCTLLSALLRSGTPIALWPRQCTGNPDEIAQEIETILATDTLEQIPDTVWQHRRKAWERDDDHQPGNHLTLLWDDPNRLPHKLMYYEAPEMGC